MSTTRNILLLVLCINLMLLLGGFELVKVGDKNMVETFVTLDENNTPTSLSSSINDTLPTVEKGFISGAITTLVNVFVDGLAMISDFFTFLINITLAPLAIFTSIPNMPQVVKLLLGVPLLVMYILGLVWFARGGSD